MSKQYCVDCEDFTEHIPKLSAIMDGYLVCDDCYRMNGFCTLTKPGELLFNKVSKKYSLNLCILRYGTITHF